MTPCKLALPLGRLALLLRDIVVFVSLDAGAQQGMLRERLALMFFRRVFVDQLMELDCEVFAELASL